MPKTKKQHNAYRAAITAANKKRREEAGELRISLWINRDHEKWFRREAAESLTKLRNKK